MVSVFIKLLVSIPLLSEGYIQFTPLPAVYEVMLLHHTSFPKTGYILKFLPGRLESDFNWNLVPEMLNPFSCLSHLCFSSWESLLLNADL